MSLSVDDVFNQISPPSGDAGGAEFIRRFKIDAKDGKNSIIVREQNADLNWENDEQELEFPHDLAIDMANMEITWSNFDGERDVVGTKLRDIMDGTASPPKQPSKDHKDGIRVYVSNSKLFPEPYRELLTNSYYAKEAFKQLYKEYQKQIGIEWVVDKDGNGQWAEPNKHEDDVPVVTFSKPKDKPTKMGKVKPPSMEITGWTSRDVFDGGSSADSDEVFR